MAGVDDLRLAQSLVDLTVEAEDSRRSFNREVEGVKAQDMIQNIQVPVSGRVGTKPILSKATVNFPYPLLLRVAPGATESDLSWPHFTFGVQMLSAPIYVAIDIQVIDFPETLRGFLDRATLQIVARAPDAPKKVNFRALVHMTIMGYAAPTETDSEG